ncbi:hypothetical protein EMCG_02701 [[Emmonsia] crescens]|uniref:Uncharacterized protein n=1 Tax=[Emmonsia] crescens TaxID=73230 RepID=A0A0G2J183_9EURO|nr:hypothetical protein EMCG_02701 [Emmonsia crescens UAMH 3008]
MSSNKAEAGATNDNAATTKNYDEIQKALPASEQNISGLENLTALESPLINLSFTAPSSADPDDKGNPNEENVPHDNDDEQEHEINNDSGDDANSTISTTNSVPSSASSSASLSTQTQMTLLARQVRSTLNEIVAVENSLAVLAAYDISEIAEHLQRTTSRILEVYISLWELFEEEEDTNGGHEMAATIRAVIGEYPTIRGRCGI